MQSNRASLATSIVPFGLFVLALYAIAVWLSGRLGGLERADVVALGLTADLVGVVPLAFYFLVVRRRKLPRLTVVPVVILSLVAASWVLPAGHQQQLRILEFLLFPAELGLITWVIWKTTRALRGVRRDGSVDLLEELRRVTHDLTRNDRVARMMASEIAIFYYALGSWRARPHAPVETTAVTHHRRSGQGGIVFALLFITAGEALLVHLLLSKWSDVAAWIFTGLSIYGALWLLADYRATVLRPILFGQRHVELRAGLRWTLRVPRGQIVSISPEEPKDLPRVGMTLLSKPTHWIQLAEPHVAHGPYGARRDVVAVGLQPDDAEKLREMDR